MTSSTLAVPRGTAADYVELVKPRITSMVMLTALVGFVMGSRGAVDLAALASVLAGTGLVAAGASTLNMVLEQRTDALMRRTQNRPLPAGRLRPFEALAWGAVLTISGIAFLAWLSQSRIDGEAKPPGPLPALVALATWGSYLFLYTPLKTRTSLSTVVCALPGGTPVLPLA